MNITGPALYSGNHSASANLNAQAYAVNYFEPGYEDTSRPICVLQGFALDASRAMIESIATNPNTPASILRKLVDHSEPDVRAALAENRNTPLDTMYELAADTNPDVRYQLAENHQIPVELLQHLAADENPYVSCRAQKTLRRIESTNSAGRIGWSAFRRAQSMRGIDQINVVAASPRTVLRRLCDTFSRYAARAI